MPKADDILKELQQKADAISAAIDRKQAATGKNIARAEKQLLQIIFDSLTRHLTFDAEGRLINNTDNLAALIQVDKAFDQFRKKVLKGVLRQYVSDLIQIAGMTGELYAGEAPAATLAKIIADNTLLLRAIGVTASGNVIKGSILWEVSNSPQVRQGVKSVVISAIQSGWTLAEFTDGLRTFIRGIKGATGRLVNYWRTYAYDIFNQAAEVKNEQFRRGLDMQWLLYVGDIIKDSRAFCVKKAGNVFAVIEADTEWPDDPDLVGKKSGIPYVPRIDRGRWNCRHRIRYITEELALQIDPAKVKLIKAKYNI